MNCKLYRNAYEEADPHGALSDGAREHLGACHECARLYRERAALRGLLGGLGRVEAPPDFDFRLRARLRSANAEARTGFFARLVSPAAASALAACAVLAVTAGVYFKRQPPRAQQTVASQAVAQAQDATGETAKAVGGSELVSAQAGGVVQKGDEVANAGTGQRSTARRRPRASAGFQNVARVQGLAAESAQSAAPILKRGDGEVTFVNPPVAVTLPASRRPLRVMLRDERGGSHALSMRPVSFGSQEFVSRLGGPARPSSDSKEGVW